MNEYSERNYTDFFKEEVYGRFVQYLLNKYGAKSVITLLRNDQLMSKKGVHPLFQKDFNVFLTQNPLIHKELLRNNSKFLNLRNIADGDLAFPIDVKDDMLMVKESIRVPAIIPVKDEITRATKEMKRSADPMKGQILRGDSNEKKYRIPKRLTVHFREKHARKIGKTTLSFMVDSRGDAMNIILDRFKDDVAYATIQNEEEFVFIKPRNGKVKRNRKLRS